MAAYHVEVRAKDGRTVCMVDCEARKVGDIEVVRSGDTFGILVNGESTAVGYPTIAEVEEGGFTAHRWPLGSTGDPVNLKIT